MRVQVKEVSRTEVTYHIQNHTKLDAEQKEILRHNTTLSLHLYIGMLSGEFACAWGLIPPSILSDGAYLWMLSRSIIKGNEFLFVRHSQIVMKEMLKRYRVIYGHTDASMDRSIRWLKWLGAKFEEGEGKLLRFTIGGDHG